MLAIFAELSDPTVVDDGFTIRVSTSAMYGEVDLGVESTLSDVGSPFLIYAKVRGKYIIQ
jgi:hypothetical protein